MDYYILKLQNSDLAVEETSIEIGDDERYILFGTSDPSRYSESLARVIIEEFKEFNLVMILNKM